MKKKIEKITDSIYTNAMQLHETLLEIIKIKKNY